MNRETSISGHYQRTPHCFEANLISNLGSDLGRNLVKMVYKYTPLSKFRSLCCNIPSTQPFEPATAASCHLPAISLAALSTRPITTLRANGRVTPHLVVPSCNQPSSQWTGILAISSSRRRPAQQLFRTRTSSRSCPKIPS